MYRTFAYCFLLIAGLQLVLQGEAEARQQTAVDIAEAFDRGEITPDRAVQLHLDMIGSEDQALDHAHSVKCLTPAFMIAEHHRDQILPETLFRLNTLTVSSEQGLKADSLHTYQSPSGKFTIVYTSAGSDSVSSADADQDGVPDYIEKVGIAADSSYRHEITTLGFIDPIPEGRTYTIRVENLGSGLYGYTTPVSGQGAQTEFYIDNDFAFGYPLNTDPEGDELGAMKVTVAHEFKHAIQYATNQWQAPSGNFSWGEMDATLMEEIVYDNVNDYYNYIKQNLDSSVPSSASIFGAPQKSTPGSYNYVTWMLYYAEASGMDVLVEVWDLIQEEPSLGIEEGLEQVLENRGKQFSDAFVQNHLWHYFSGLRATDPDYGFEEKENYPNAYVESRLSLVSDEAQDVESIPVLAARYMEIEPAGGDRGIIDLAVNMDTTQIGIGVIVYEKGGAVYEYIATGSDKPQQYLPLKEHTWESVNRISVVLANFSNNRPTGELKLLVGKDGSRFKIEDPDFKERPEKISLSQNYPNPFNPETTIEFDLDQSARVVLEVFDITGRKVRTLVDDNRLFGNYTVRFNALDLASGVYLYRLRSGNSMITKKLTIIK